MKFWLVRNEEWLIVQAESEREALNEKNCQKHATHWKSVSGADYTHPVEAPDWWTAAKQFEAILYPGSPVTDHEPQG